MWQRDWDQWRIENFPDARPAEYLSKKLVTNFTEEIYEELLEYENQFISKLNSKPKCSEPQQKSEQNNNKTESNQTKTPNIDASPSTMPSRKNAVLKKLRERKEERLKNALVPSRTSKSQNVTNPPVTPPTKDQENDASSRLGSPKTFYNHGMKSPADSQCGDSPPAPESQNTCPLGGLFDAKPTDNQIKTPCPNGFIPKRNHSKFKTRDENDSDDDSLQKALTNLKIRHHA